MGNIWFTADLHLLHKTIVKFTKRPISQELHDAWLINRINERVGPRDILYILGDFSMDSRSSSELIARAINGRKHLILGNHDKNLKNSKVFDSVSLIKNIKPKIDTKRQAIVLCHFPMASWEDKVKESWHLHGHTHGRYRGPGLIWDVGVDNNNYYPLELSEINTIMNKINKNEF